LRELVGALPDLDPLREGPFDRAKTRSVIQGFLHGENKNEALVRQLVMVAVWHQSYRDYLANS
jgi:hypothetical protein